MQFTTMSRTIPPPLRIMTKKKFSSLWLVTNLGLTVIVSLLVSLNLPTESHKKARAKQLTVTTVLIFGQKFDGEVAENLLIL